MSSSIFSRSSSLLCPGREGEEEGSIIALLLPHRLSLVVAHPLHPLTRHRPLTLPVLLLPPPCTLQDIHPSPPAPAEPALLGASPAPDDVILPPDSSSTTITITNSSSRNSTNVTIAPTPPTAPALLLFPADAQLQDLTGALVDANEALEGKSVGLYFGAGWCSMTRAANPGVSAWIKAREVEGVALGEEGGREGGEGSIVLIHLFCMEIFLGGSITLPIHPPSLFPLPPFLPPSHPSQCTSPLTRMPLALGSNRPTTGGHSLSRTTALFGRA